MSAFGDPADWGDPSAAQIRLVLQLMQRIHTAIPVKVISCTNDGGVSAIGRVTVQPMIELVSDQGIVSPRAQLVDLPYQRISAGANAVIMDPQDGDIGVAIFAEKDISGMLASGDSAPPGSARVFDMADGIYLYTIVGAAPTQYVRFSDDGISLVSPTKVSLQAPEVDITAPVVDVTASTSITFTTPLFTVNGMMTVTGDITGDGVDLKTHRHSGVQGGSSDTGPPV